MELATGDVEAFHCGFVEFDALLVDARVERAFDFQGCRADQRAMRLPRLGRSAGARSIPPEILEPIRRQRRVDRGAGDRPMAEPACPGVAARAKPTIVMTPVRHQAIQEVFLGRPDGLQADRP
jgi:hypothetical protein